MNRTGNGKENESDSERQILHVFSHIQNLDSKKEKKLHECKRDIV
jgi:hypothetical protein